MGCASSTSASGKKRAQHVSSKKGGVKAKVSKKQTGKRNKQSKKRISTAANSGNEFDDLGLSSQPPSLHKRTAILPPALKKKEESIDYGTTPDPPFLPPTPRPADGLAESVDRSSPTNTRGAGDNNTAMSTLFTHTENDDDDGEEEGSSFLLPQSSSSRSSLGGGGAPSKRTTTATINTTTNSTSIHNHNSSSNAMPNSIKRADPRSWILTGGTTTTGNNTKALASSSNVAAGKKKKKQQQHRKSTDDPTAGDAPDMSNSHVEEGMTRTAHRTKSVKSAAAASSSRQGGVQKEKKKKQQQQQQLVSRVPIRGPTSIPTDTSATLPGSMKKLIQLWVDSGDTGDSAKGELPLLEPQDLQGQMRKEKQAEFALQQKQTLLAAASQSNGSASAVFSASRHSGSGPPRRRSKNSVDGEGMMVVACGASASVDGQQEEHIPEVVIGPSIAALGVATAESSINLGSFPTTLTDRYEPPPRRRQHSNHDICDGGGGVQPRFLNDPSSMGGGGWNTIYKNVIKKESPVLPARRRVSSSVALWNALKLNLGNEPTDINIVPREGKALGGSDGGSSSEDGSGGGAVAGGGVGSQDVNLTSSSVSVTRDSPPRNPFKASSA